MEQEIIWLLQWQQFSLWWIQFKTSMHDIQKKKKNEAIKYIRITTIGYLKWLNLQVFNVLKQGRISLTYFELYVYINKIK